MQVLAGDLAVPAATESRSSRHNDHSSLRIVILPGQYYPRKSASNSAQREQQAFDDRQPNGPGAGARPLRRRARRAGKQALTAASR
jgi:hypothetical protein